MPEGDTVFRTARRLDAALAGHEVTRFELRVPQVATADLRGETVHGVASRGKHLLHRIGEWTLHSHLKMEGEWHVYRPGEKWRQPSFKARAIVGHERVRDGRVRPRRHRCGAHARRGAPRRPPRSRPAVGRLGSGRSRAAPGRGPPAGARRAAGSAQRRRLRQRVRQRDPVRARHPSDDTGGRDGCRGPRRSRRPHDPRQPRARATARSPATRGPAGPPGCTAARGDRAVAAARASCGGELGADPTRERIVFWCPSCQR